MSNRLLRDISKYVDFLKQEYYNEFISTDTIIIKQTEEVEALRERGTGEHELSTVPNVAAALDEIRTNLNEQYKDEYTYEELSARIAVPEGMTGYQNDENAQGDNRDTGYL